MYSWYGPITGRAAFGLRWHQEPSWIYSISHALITKKRQTKIERQKKKFVFTIWIQRTVNMMSVWSMKTVILWGYNWPEFSKLEYLRNGIPLQATPPKNEGRLKIWQNNPRLSQVPNQPSKKRYQERLWDYNQAGRQGKKSLRTGEKSRKRKVTPTSDSNLTPLQSVRARGRRSIPVAEDVPTSPRSCDGHIKLSTSFNSSWAHNFFGRGAWLPPCMLKALH